jgi:hypothetical protein
MAAVPKLNYSSCYVSNTSMPRNIKEIKLCYRTHKNMLDPVKVDEVEE